MFSDKKIGNKRKKKPAFDIEYQKAGGDINQAGRDININYPAPKERIKCVVVVGSAYAEHTLQLNKDVILGEKQSAIVNDFYGGSGINYSLRLARSGIPTIPVLPIGTDISEDIRNMLLTSEQKIETFENASYLIKSKEFSCGISKTPHSYILIEKEEERRTIFGEGIEEIEFFKAHIQRQINEISQNPNLIIKAIVIGHIPEHGDESQNASKCTKYLINRFKGKCFVFTNFGDSQIRLGVKFWENELNNIDVFQLNLSEIRKFFSKKSDVNSLFVCV